MKRNIVVSFAAHIVIGCVCLLIVKFVFDWYTRTFRIGFILFWLLFVFFLYIIVGRLFLKKVEGRLQGFLSIWSLGIFSLSIFLVMLIDGIIMNSFDLLGLVCLVNPISFLFQYSIKAFYHNLHLWDSTLFISLIISPFIPSAGMWIGLKSKNIKIKIYKEIQA